MMRREEARLRSLFQRLLLLSAAASPAACSSQDSAQPTDASTTPDSTQPGGGDGAPGGPTPDGGGSPDATIAVDGNAPADSGGGAAIDALDPFGFLDSACDPQYVDGEADGSGCDFFERLPCGLPPGSATERCDLLVAQCGILCGQVPTLARVCGVSECLIVDASTIPTTTPLTLDCATGLGGCAPGVGRRPCGLARSTPARRGSATGAVLAEMAHLEAASIDAFRRLGAELASMRAPSRLIRRAERSAADEVRHARVTARLARRHGAMPAPVVINRRRRARSVADFAVENAVEGCVRESFGALVAMRQAAAARDPEVARAMDRIARDETRHAALAWEIAAWLTPQLDAAARARVTRAVRSAVESLRCEIALTHPDVASDLGLPAGAEGERLVAGFARECFARRSSPRPTAGTPIPKLRTPAALQSA